jgi:hypothetical protein
MYFIIYAHLLYRRNFMKMQKFACALFSLLLCSCLVEEEAEPENTPLPDISSDLSSSSSPSIEPSNSSSSVEPPEPSILDCPPEDIAEYPVSEPYIVINPDPDRQLVGGVDRLLVLSVEELSFGKQGGVRCVAASESFAPRGGEGCIPEGSGFDFVNKLRREVCQWFVATRLDDGRTLHVSVNKNETGKKREARMVLSIVNTGKAEAVLKSV